MRKFVMIACLLAAGIMYSDAGIYDSADITGIMERVCDYGLKLFPSSKLPSTNEYWATGVFFTGVLAAYYSTGQQRFLDSATAFATFNNWKLNVEWPGDPNADIHAQTYCELYLLDPKPENSYMIADFISLRRSSTSWGFGDALFMAPPAYVRLGAATKDTSLFSFVNREWQRTIDMLFDWDAGMIYTLSEYIYPLAQTTYGKKRFWSRGNGWVTSGAVRVLEYLPENDPGREQYINLLRVMAASISKVQGSDGLWRTSLLDSAEYPGPETSGSALFCHSIAYGIRMGYLDSATYIPVVLKAWKGLVEKVTPEGRVTCAQGPSTIPGWVEPDNTENFTVGAFLLAGREMLLLNYKNDTTPPAPVVMNSAEALHQDIRISWRAGVDAESGIDGYEIYRDTAPGAAKLLKTVRHVDVDTEYTDVANQDETKYYYRLKAVNGMGLRSAEFSNEVSATTGQDTTRPIIVGVTAFSDSSVHVLFSKSVEAQTAEDAAHYTISPGITVKSSRMAGEKVVVLTTSPLTRIVEYTLSVSGVKDRTRAGNLILPVDRKFSLFYYYDDFEAGGKLSWQPKTASRWSIGPDNGDNAYSVSSGEGGEWFGEYSIGEYSLFQGVTVDQFEISVNVRTTVEDNHPFGIIFGYQNSANCFFIGDWFGIGRLVRFANGQSFPLFSFYPIGDTAYHNLAVSYIGGTVVISKDGVEMGRCVFDNIPAGQVGLRSSSGYPVYFDDFKLKLLSDGYTTVSPVSNPSVEPEIAAQPNPFNPSARISYCLSQKSQVNLVLYNLQGKVVRKLASGMVSAGRHMVQVDAGGLASGIYICELKSSATAKRLKLVLMR